MVFNTCRVITLSPHATTSCSGWCSIARSLYEAADGQLDDLKHAPAAACTPEGQAFAEAMGGEIADEMDELADYYEMIEEN